MRRELFEILTCQNIKEKLIQRNNKALKREYLRSGSEGQAKTLMVI